MGSDMSMYESQWKPRRSTVWLNRRARWEVFVDTVGGWKRQRDTLPDVKPVRDTFKVLGCVVADERPVVGH